MRLGKGGMLLLTAIGLLAGIPALLAVILHVSETTLGGFFRTLVSLEQAWEMHQQLEEEFRKTAENARLKESVLQGLIRKDYSLREAVSLYRPLCRAGDLLSIRSRTQQLNAGEEEILALHLVDLVSRHLKPQPGVRAQLLPVLERECALIRAGQAALTSLQPGT